MSIEDTKSMIDALANDNTVDAEKHIKNALADKVGTELDQRRKDLAGTIMKQPEAQDGDNAESIEIDD
tara:strand:- start:36 stop:239 length:204 start_codon:yes stop_codon:yes gene_type:complete